MHFSSSYMNNIMNFKGEKYPSSISKKKKSNKTLNGMLYFTIIQGCQF